MPGSFRIYGWRNRLIDTKSGRGGVEIHAGAGQRRRWSDEEKGEIVAEAVVPGAGVSEVARRHDMTAYAPVHLDTSGEGRKICAAGGRAAGFCMAFAKQTDLIRARLLRGGIVQSP